MDAAGEFPKRRTIRLTTAKNSREICPIFYERKESIYDHSLLKHRPSRPHE